MNPLAPHKGHNHPDYIRTVTYKCRNIRSGILLLTRYVILCIYTGLLMQASESIFLNSEIFLIPPICNAGTESFPVYRDKPVAQQFVPADAADN